MMSHIEFVQRSLNNLLAAKKLSLQNENRWDFRRISISRDTQIKSRDSQIKTGSV